MENEYFLKLKEIIERNKDTIGERLHDKDNPYKERSCPDFYIIHADEGYVEIKILTNNEIKVHFCMSEVPLSYLHKRTLLNLAEIYCDIRKDVKDEKNLKKLMKG